MPCFVAEDFGSGEVISSREWQKKQSKSVQSISTFGNVFIHGPKQIWSHMTRERTVFTEFHDRLRPGILRF